MGTNLLANVTTHARRMRAFALLVSAVGAACTPPPRNVVAGHAGASDEPTAIRPKEADALREGDFVSPLTRQFIRSTRPAMSDEEFAVAWRAAVSKGAYRFLRVFPQAYHADFAQNLSQAAVRKIPPEVGICFGDAHPDNFRFLERGAKVSYAYNDFDDSGYCPIALDALHYAVAVRLGYDRDAMDRLVDRYVAVVTGQRSEAEANADIDKVRERQTPNFAEHRRKRLVELAQKDALRLDSGMARVDGATRSTLERVVVTALSGAAVLDVASLERKSGGSAALARYWLLVQRGSTSTVVELKETGKPGVDLGLSARPIAADERLGALEHALWGESVAIDYEYVEALGKRFLLHDRLAMAPLDLGALSQGDLREVFDAQAAMIGLAHKRVAKQGTDRGRALKQWLSESAEVVADRWKRAHHE
jgi:hypothetical protein